MRLSVYCGNIFGKQIGNVFVFTICFDVGLSVLCCKMTTNLQITYEPIFRFGANQNGYEADPSGGLWAPGTLWPVTASLRAELGQQTQFANRSSRCRRQPRISGAGRVSPSSSAAPVEKKKFVSVRTIKGRSSSATKISYLVRSIVLLLFLQKQNLATAIYLVGLG